METNIRIRSLLLIPLFATVLSACAPTVITGRMSAATYQMPPQGASFTLAGSGAPTLTERQIQELIKAQLESRGFRFTAPSDDADFLVVFSYSMGAGKTVVSSSPDFVWGGQKVSSSTSYPRYFQISMVDVASSQKENQVVFAWQAEIYSSGSSQNISWLAEHFVPKLFEKFGESVSSERVFIPATVPVL